MTESVKRARERYYSDNGMSKMPSLVVPLTIIPTTFLFFALNALMAVVNLVQLDWFAIVNCIAAAVCFWGFSQYRIAYRDQIERRAEWRKKKYEAWLAKIPREIEVEDWPAIEEVIGRRLKEGAEGTTLADAKWILRREKERAERAKMQPCAHLNTETFYTSTMKVVCTDCGTNLPYPYVPRQRNPFGRRLPD